MANRTKDRVIGLLALGLTLLAQTAFAAPSAPEPEALTEEMEEQMLEFVRHNYPSRMSKAVRSMQNDESSLKKNLTEAAGFLKEFAQGPVTLEGRWESNANGGKAKYLLLSIVKGVHNYPNAVVTFRTCPGMFRPFTVVQVDENGDGKVDEQSSALLKREKMVEWLAQRFPQAVCIAQSER